MQFGFIAVWVEKAFSFLVEKYLSKKYPGMKAIFDNIDLVLEIAAEVVSAAEASKADGPAKKAQATKALSDGLKSKGIDIPGDQDEAICGLVVEAMVAALKKVFRLS